MGKVIKISKGYESSSGYQKQLELNIAKLDKIKDDLIGLAINTATKGKWQEWSDGIKEGEEFSFTEEMLKDSGDENVDNLASLIDTIIITKEIMKFTLH